MREYRKHLLNSTLSPSAIAGKIVAVKTERGKALARVLPWVASQNFTKVDLEVHEGTPWAPRVRIVRQVKARASKITLVPSSPPDFVLGRRKPM